MTIWRRDSQFKSHERIIAEGIVDVATELRLADASEIMLMIRNDQNANLADLVNSSTELYFKTGTLKYALVAGCDIRWDSSPTILLDMEFRHASVNAFFRLMLGETRAGVEIIDIFFDEDGLDADAKTRRLLEAIADARLCGAPPAVQQMTSD
jgi:hypothetical protein